MTITKEIVIDGLAVSKMERKRRPAIEDKFLWHSIKLIPQQALGDRKTIHLRLKAFGHFSTRAFQNR